MIEHIDCKSLSQNIKQDLKNRLKENLFIPVLHIIQVGDNPASNAYVKGKMKDCEEVGFGCNLTKIPETSKEQVKEDIELAIQFPHISGVTGVIVQLPLPFGLDFDYVKSVVPQNLDVDGFNPDSMCEPCTPAAVMHILRHTCGETLSGLNVVLIGRSKLVGMPLFSMLVEKDATVTLCHSHTSKETLRTLVSQADIVVSAAGVAGLLSTDMFKDGCVVIDVGINKVDNHLCGDIKEVPTDKYIRLTPVPGGVGLLTRAKLLENTYRAMIENTYK